MARGVLVPATETEMRHEPTDASPASRTSERDIRDSYLYLLGRLLVLRQEHFDLISGSRWNQLEHRDAGLDVVASDAWIAVDERNATILDVPKIVGRYYTIQVINPWGETITNINERTYPNHPFGTFAFCLRGSRLGLPVDARRIDLPGRKARIRIRIELGCVPSEAVALQRKLGLRSTGRPVVPPTIGIPLFTNERLPGVEAFDRALAILASEQDINPGTETLQARVRVLAALVRDPHERRRVDRVIRDQPVELRHALYMSGHDWTVPRVAGSYGADWLGRTASNLHGLWSNTKTEVVSFEIASPLDGNVGYTMTFEQDDLPASHVKYLWSISCVDRATARPVANAENRHLLDQRSGLRLEPDGKLRLHFAADCPAGVPRQNWLPTPTSRDYRLTWRSYGPDRATISGRWFPPSLQLAR
jgi:hypothetical protein